MSEKSPSVECLCGKPMNEPLLQRIRNQTLEEVEKIIQDLQNKHGYSDDFNTLKIIIKNLKEKE